MFQVLNFTKSNCRDFIGNDEWSPIHPTSIHWIIRFGGNAGVLLQAATKAKTVFKFTEALADCRRQCCERLSQATADMCINQWWKF